MTTSNTLYDYVMRHLDARRYSQRNIAAGSDVPFSTVAKIAQRSVKDPSVHTVQRLADWFRAQPGADTEPCPSVGLPQNTKQQGLPEGDCGTGFGEPRTGEDRRDDDRRDLAHICPEPCTCLGGMGEPRTGDDRRDDERRDQKSAA